MSIKLDDEIAKANHKLSEMIQYRHKIIQTLKKRWNDLNKVENVVEYVEPTRSLKVISRHRDQIQELQEVYESIVNEIEMFCDELFDYILEYEETLGELL